MNSIDNIKNNFIMNPHQVIGALNLNIIEENKSFIRIGNKNGSLHITRRGEKAGLWHDFNGGAGGSVIDLWIYCHGGNEHEALTELEKIYDIKSEIYVPNYIKRASEKKDTSKIIQHIISKALPLSEGDIAYKYLTETRNIKPSVLSSCVDLMYLPAGKYPHGLLQVIRGHDTGRIQAIQITYLSNDAKKLNEYDITDSKTGEIITISLNGGRRIIGSHKNAGVYLPSHDKATYRVNVCEGVETGLSVIQQFDDVDNVCCILSKSKLEESTSFAGVETIAYYFDSDIELETMKNLKKLTKESCSMMCKDLCNSSCDRFKAYKPKEKGADFNDTL